MCVSVRVYVGPRMVCYNVRYILQSAYLGINVQTDVFTMFVYNPDGIVIYPCFVLTVCMHTMISHGLRNGHFILVNVYCL